MRIFPGAFKFPVAKPSFLPVHCFIRLLLAFSLWSVYSKYLLIDWSWRWQREPIGGERSIDAYFFYLVDFRVLGVITLHIFNKSLIGLFARRRCHLYVQVVIKYREYGFFRVFCLLFNHRRHFCTSVPVGINRREGRSLFKVFSPFCDCKHRHISLRVVVNLRGHPFLLIVLSNVCDYRHSHVFVLRLMNTRLVYGSFFSCDRKHTNFLVSLWSMTVDTIDSLFQWLFIVLWLRAQVFFWSGCDQQPWILVSFYGSLLLFLTTGPIAYSAMLACFIFLHMCIFFCWFDTSALTVKQAGQHQPRPRGSNDSHSLASVCKLWRVYDGSSLLPYRPCPKTRAVPSGASGVSCIYRPALQGARSGRVAGAGYGTGKDWAG